MEITSVLSYANLVSAAVSAAIAVAIALQVRRVKVAPRRLLLALTAFFLLRAADRLAAPDPFLGYRPEVDAAIEGAIFLVLAIILLDAARLARGIIATVAESELRRAEYERATRDYAALVRHRLANPLTVIKGAAQTIEADVVDGTTRTRLAAAIIESAETMERTALDPRRAGAEEHELDPTVRVPTSRGDNVD